RPDIIRMQTAFISLLLWDALGLMLLGMAFFKWGFFTGRLPRRTYVWLLAAGYGLGIPLVLYSWWYNHQHTSRLAFFDAHPFNLAIYLYPIQRLLLVVAHASLLILLVQSGAGRGLVRALAAVGQMALTNYLMQTIICTLFFFGYGLGYFARLQYYQLFYVVGAIWAFQLLCSPVWLRHFRFGPVEWLWRSLTYWKRQPMHREAAQPTLAAKAVAD
ncbi:MAG: DUF418 domain-containing protein, partial [Ferruginibacter sp.]|nr:DUF418 domain-containing protein [Cytophagales bacterium]